MTGNKKSWSDLTPTQRKAVVVGGAVELVLTAWAASDLRRRPAEQVRGPKAAWVVAFAVQPLGPIAYLVVGRR